MSARSHHPKLGHCPLCGVNMDMPGVGTRHRCVPRTPPAPESAPAKAASPPKPTQKQIEPVTHGASLTSEPVTHTAVTHAITHTASIGTSQPDQPTSQAPTKPKAAERQARYRARHGDTYREKHRDLMRRLRQGA